MILQFKDKKTTADFIQLDEKVGQSQQDQFNSKLNSTYTIKKYEKMDLEDFDFTNYKHIEKKTDQVVSTDISASGTVGTLYIGISYVNSNEAVPKEKIAEIYQVVYSAFLEMTK